MSAYFEEYYQVKVYLSCTCREKLFYLWEMGFELCWFMSWCINNGSCVDRLSLPGVLRRRPANEEKIVDPRLPPTSTYLLPDQPARGGKKSKTHTKTNLYVLVEFGVQVSKLTLYCCGQREFLSMWLFRCFAANVFVLSSIIFAQNVVCSCWTSWRRKTC